MENRNVSLGSIALKYGAILAAISIAIFLIGVATKNPEIGSLWLEILILIGGILLAHREYKKRGDGYMNYGTGLGLGTFVAGVSAVISAIFTYIYIKFINTSYLQEAQEMQIEALEREGLTDEQIEMGLDFAEKISTPEIISLLAIFGTLFIGFILSLIISAFTKNDNPELSV